MNLILETLEQHLQSTQLTSCYLLIGIEPFLLQEAQKILLSFSKKQGFMTRQLWEVNNNLNWDQLHHDSCHLDLFSPGTFLELRCRQSLTEALGNQLSHFIKIAIQRTHQMIVISFYQLSPSSQKAAWFKQLSNIGVSVILNPPTLQAWANWLKKRLARVNLTLNQEALMYFSDATEGNILAAGQTIEKLALIYHKSTILNLKQIQMVMGDHAKFELFSLTDAILHGQSERCLRILNYLEITTVAPSLVLGYLLNILRSLNALCYGVRLNQPLEPLFKKHRIWVKHQSYFRQAIIGATSKELTALFSLAHVIDRHIKGLEKGMNYWHALQNFTVQLSGFYKKS